MSVVEYFQFLITGKNRPKNLEIVEGTAAIKDYFSKMIEEKSKVHFRMKLLFGYTDGTTLVLKLAEKDGKLLFITDMFNSEKINKAALKSGKVLVSCKVEGIPFAFMASAFMLLKKSKSIAFNFPERVYLIQRRKHFRVNVSQAKKKIYVEFDYQSVNYRLAAFDISIGGVSFYSYFRKDEMIKNVKKDESRLFKLKLVFPDKTIIYTQVAIKNALDIKRTGFSSRVCAKFIEIKDHDLAYIQEYVKESQMKNP